MKKAIKYLFFLLFVITAALLLFFFYNRESDTVKPENEYFQIHVLDVGQGDSIFVKCGSKNILIDGGENGKGAKIVKYLQNQNIQSLDMVIATHPHIDHIGGLYYVMSNIPTQRFMISNTPDDLIPTSKTYENLLNLIYDSNIDYITPQTGNSIDFDGVNMEILWDGSGGTNLNDTSLALRFVYKDTSFITCGDDGSEVEIKIAENFKDIKCDILKIGHHGSNDATCIPFVNAVSPKYAAISLGEDNSYGFPTKKTLNTLRTSGVIYYRTDLQGTVVFTSDGNNIGVKTSK